MASTRERPAAFTSTDHDEGPESLLPGPDVDVTQTRRWLHPVHLDALSLEGHMMYNNMLVLADYLREILRHQRRQLATNEKTRSNGQGLSGTEDVDTVTSLSHEDDGEEEKHQEDGDGEENATGHQANPKSRKQATKRKAVRGQTSIQTAVNLLEEGDETLLMVFKDWIVLENKDVRRTRSKTNDHLVDIQAFFSSYLPQHNTITTHHDLFEKLQSHSDIVKEEVYLQLGRSFVKQQPQLTKHADKRRHFRKSSSGRRTSSTGSGGSVADSPANSTASNSKRRVSLNIRPGETRHPASSPTASSDIELPRKRQRTREQAFDHDGGDENKA
ncbi:hypothetical protein ABEF94_011282 [Exophiala dermatitidis]